MPDVARTPSAAAYHRQLELIAEMSHEFANSRDLGNTLQYGLEQVVAFVGAEAASLFLIDQRTSELVCRACVGPVNITGLRLAAGQGVVGQAVAQNRTVFVKDAGKDPYFAAKVDAKTGFATRSILCAPLSLRDQCLGAIELLNKAGGDVFHSGDRQVLRALGASAALAISNARLTAAMVEQERMRREVELAAEIQRGMLPNRLPAGFPVQGINRPAYAVSGDFFDIVPLPGERVAFAIGDVSGKGINASLLMAKTISLFHCLAKTHARPGPLLAAINQELCETAGSGGTFVTMVAGLLDRRTGSVLLANAGHEPPLLRRGGAFVAFEAASPPLGIAPELVPESLAEHWIELAGDALYLFTDGLTESLSEDAMATDAMVGAEGVGRLIDEAAALPAEDRLRAILDRLCADGAALRDDLTLLVVEDQRPRPLLAQRLLACPDCLCRLRLQVREAALAAGCRPEAAEEVVLAVDEACQNVIRHAYGGDGEIVLEIRRDPPGALEVQLIDFAPPIDPDRVAPRPLDDLRPGGLGTHFIRSVMDEVSFLPPPPGAGNFLRLSKAIP